MLSPVDTAVICGLALLLFGPKKLPEIGSAIGKGLGNFKKALTDAQDEVKHAASTDAKPPVTAASPAIPLAPAPTSPTAPEEEHKSP